MIETTRVSFYERQRDFAIKNHRFWLAWALTSTRTVAYQSTYPLLCRRALTDSPGRFAAAAFCWLCARFSSPAAPFSRAMALSAQARVVRDSRFTRVSRVLSLAISL
jgi:hypothetical protein